jgi:tight adherence protein B
MPGCDGLRLLAGCWRIGVDRGAMLAAVIEGLSEALRDEQSHREEITLQLAGPRATARLLAVLPALGLGMAAALGARPLPFLFGTLPGAVCLALGLGLDALGLWWTARLATAAEQTQ